MAVIAIRGATQVGENENVAEATGELITCLIERNGLMAGDLVSLFLTVTPDLRADVVRAAARLPGLSEVPAMSAVEIAVPGALPRVVRLMAHADLSRPRSAVVHVYLRGAAALRPDLTQVAPT